MDRRPDIPDNLSMEDAMRIANSSAGKRLIAMLQQQNGDALQKAMNEAASGNYDQAKTALSSMLNSPEVKKLLEQLGGGHG